MHFKITYKKDIKGTCCTDVLMGTFCWSYSICQIYNEVILRGSGKRAVIEGSDRWAEDPITALCKCPTCITASLLPCCTYAMARKYYDDSNFCFNLFCVPPCLSMSIIRSGYGIKGGCLVDCVYGVVPCFCCMGSALALEHVKIEKEKYRAPLT